MRALVFPGQGSQEVGMGKELFQAFPEARDVFQEVDEALSQSLTALIFDGPIEQLTLTENTQPALMATPIAVLRVLLKQGSFTLHELCAYAAGHSLGEYSALCAADAISLADTARLLRTRGTAMQAATPIGTGAMAAIIGPDIAVIEEIVQAAAQGDVCEIANDNSNGQVVISGSAAAIARAEGIAKEKGAKRFVILNVSAPFHCQLMQPAAERMKHALESTQINTPSVPIITNVSASPTTDTEAIPRLLVEQVTGRVRWRESISALHKNGVTETLELGAGKVLTGLTRRIERDMNAAAINTPQDIETFIEGSAQAA